jgi:hypothetical protein
MAILPRATAGSEAGKADSQGFTNNDCPYLLNDDGSFILIAVDSSAFGHASKGIMHDGCEEVDGSR